jgi:hypothetical protein
MSSPADAGVVEAIALLARRDASSRELVESCLARIRERGTVELEYGERDVRIHGRAAPSLAGELGAVADAWRRSVDGDEANGTGVAPAASTARH